MPGHAGIGMNPEVDQIASNAYSNDSHPGKTLFEVSSLLKLSKLWKEKKFSEYLKNNVMNSSDPLNPCREMLKRLKYTRKEVIQTREDTILWRLRTGHNRLNHHLKRLNMSESELCKYCNSEDGDGYHTFICCQSVPHVAEFETLRFEVGLRSRDEWNAWLFNQDEFIQPQRNALLKLILRSGIEI